MTNSTEQLKKELQQLDYEPLSEEQTLDHDGLLEDDRQTESLAKQLINLLNLPDDQSEFLLTYEENYGRAALRERIKTSLDWDQMKP